MSLIVSTELVVMRCWCGISHAVPEDLRDQQKRQWESNHTQTGIYCPLGHIHIIAGKSGLAQAQADLQRERAAHDQTRAAKESALSSLKNEVEAMARLKKRVSRGICPCCKRTVSQLARHMATKHPEYK